MCETPALVISSMLLLISVLICLLTIGIPIEKIEGFQQIAGPIIINASPGVTKSFSWGLLAGENETSLLKIYADGNGSEFLSYPDSFRLEPGKINYLLGNVTVPSNQDIGITLTPIIHSTLSENDTESTGGNDVNVELSKILTISIGGNTTIVSGNLPSNAPQTGPLSGLITKGTINSLITTPTTKWIASGNWSLNVFNGNVTSFETKMIWNDINGTDSHTEQFQNFRVGKSILLNQSDSNISLRGLMDVGANNRVVWKDIPSTININGKKTISISVDDNKTNNHFASQPILGVINSFLFCSDVPGPNMQILEPCSESRSPASGPLSSNSESSMSVNSNPPQQSTSEIDSSEASQPIQHQNDVGPSNPSESNTSVNTVDTNLDNDSKNYLTFENSTFGVKLRYPSNWNLKQGSTINPLLEIISVISPINDEGSSFRIGIHSAESGLVNIKEFANKTIGKYEKDLPNFQTILYNPDSVLSGHSAYQIKGAYTDKNSVKQHLTETGALFNNKIYIFQFNAADSKSASYLPSVSEMVESVEFTSPPPSESTAKASSLEESPSGNSTQTCQEVSVINATANGFETDPKDYNPPQDAVDKDLETWWAYKGIPSWLQIELDTPTSICALEIAWNKGNERTYEFTIATSDDGSNFTEVFSSRSSGKKESFETYQIDSPPTDVKIINLSFSGSSSEKGWVSIKEVKVLGR